MKRKLVAIVFGVIAALACVSVFIACSGGGDNDSEKSVLEYSEVDGGYSVKCSDTSVTNITIPETYNGKPVTSIGDRAFSDCSSLTSITIPNSVTSIGDYAFFQCSSLTSITIPDSVQVIGSSAFRWCSSLTSITLPFIGASKDGTSNTHFGYIFGASSSDNNRSRVPSSLKTVVITGGTTIDSHAFYGCSGLTSITIPNSVTSIGSEAFSVCSSLTSITIPSSVTSIGEQAFSGCNALTIYCEATSEPSGWYNSYSYPYSWNYSSCPVVWDCKNNNKDENGYEYSIIDGMRYGLKDGAAIVAGQPKNISGSITIPTSVTYNGTNYSVTSIGEDAFYECSSLASITLPTGVKNIGDWAFYLCSSLTSITIPSSVTSIGWSAFRDCSSLTSITVASGNTKYHSAGNCLIETATRTLIAGCKNSVIPTDGSVTSIGYKAFYDCSSLTSITIPNSVTSIGDYAFENCRSLTSITIPNSVTSIGNSAFSGCDKLIQTENGVQYVGKWIVDCDTSVTSVSLRANMVGIADNAFYGCRNLTSITIPTGVTSIGYHAFEDCSELTTVNWNATACTSAGSSLYPIFSNCSKLTTINIGNNVTTIPSYAFFQCSSLTSITIPNSVTSIGDYAFFQCSSLTSITIPNSVTSIGDYAFENCRSLTSITIPNSVTSIGNSAFSGCNALTIYCEATSKPNGWYNSYSYPYYSWNYSSCPVVWDCKNNDVATNGYEYSIINGIRYGIKDGVATVVRQSENISDSITIPTSVTYKGTNYSVTSIGDNAFSYCSSLTSITIPNSVTSIGKNAFSCCSSLASITFQGTKAQWNAITKGIFWNGYTGNYVIHCTDGTVD